MINEDDPEDFLEGLSEAVSEAVFHRTDCTEEYPETKRIVRSQDSYEGGNSRESSVAKYDGAENWTETSAFSPQDSPMRPWREKCWGQYREPSPEHFFSNPEPGRPPVVRDVRRVCQSSQNTVADYHGFIAQRQVQRYDKADIPLSDREKGTYAYPRTERLDGRYDYDHRHHYLHMDGASRNAPPYYASTHPIPSYRRTRPYSPERYPERRRVITPRLKNRQSRSRVLQHSDEPQIPFEKLLKDHQRSQVSSRNIASAIKHRLTDTSPISSANAEKAKMDFGGKSLFVDDIKKELEKKITARPKLRSPDRRKQHVMLSNSSSSSPQENSEAATNVLQSSQKAEGVSTPQSQIQDIEIVEEVVEINPDEYCQNADTEKPQDKQKDGNNVAVGHREEIKPMLKPQLLEDVEIVGKVIEEGGDEDLGKLKAELSQPEEVEIVEEVIEEADEDDHETSKLKSSNAEAKDAETFEAENVQSGLQDAATSDTVAKEISSEDHREVEIEETQASQVEVTITTDLNTFQDEQKENTNEQKTSLSGEKAKCEEAVPEQSRNQHNISEDADLTENVANQQQPTSNLFTESNVVAENHLHDENPEHGKDNDTLQESDDEELLNLRLLALSSAYKRNIDIVKGDTEKQDTDKSAKAAKAKKKKPKQKKKENATEEKRPSTRSKSTEKIPPKSYRTEKDRRSFSDQRSKLRSSSSTVRKPELPSRKTREKSPKPKDLRDPKILTLGGELLRKRQQREKDSLAEIRNLGPEEGSKQFIKLMETRSRRIRKAAAKPSANTKKTTLEGDNYEEVEMEVDSDLEQSNKTKTQDAAIVKETETSVNGNTESEPLPPGAELDHTPSQESIWKLLDSPMVPKPEAKPGDANVGPPGTDTTLNHTPSQESIWRLLDSPLAPKASKLPTDTGIPAPESSLVAAADNSLSKESRSTDILASTPSPIGSVDSCNEFQHAFDPSTLPFPMESTLVGEHSVSNDVDPVARGDRHNNARKSSPPAENGSRAKTAVDEGEANSGSDRQPIPVSIKRQSTESADELREQLLQEILTKRAQTRLAESAQPIPTVQSSHVLPVPTPMPPPAVPQHLFSTRPPIFSIPPFSSHPPHVPTPQPGVSLVLPPPAIPVPPVAAQYAPLFPTATSLLPLAPTVPTQPMPSPADLPVVAQPPTVSSATGGETGPDRPKPVEEQVEPEQPKIKFKSYLYRARRKCKAAEEQTRVLLGQVKAHKRLKRDPKKLKKLEKALKQSRLNERVFLRRLKQRTVQEANVKRKLMLAALKESQEAAQSAVSSKPTPVTFDAPVSSAKPSLEHKAATIVSNNQEGHSRPIGEQSAAHNTNLLAPSSSPNESLMGEPKRDAHVGPIHAENNDNRTQVTQEANKEHAAGIHVPINTAEASKPKTPTKSLPPTEPTGHSEQTTLTPSKPVARRKSVFSRLGKRTPSTTIDFTVMTGGAKVDATAPQKVEGLDDMLKRLRAQTAKVAVPAVTCAVSPVDNPQTEATTDAEMSSKACHAKERDRIDVAPGGVADEAVTETHAVSAVPKSCSVETSAAALGAIAAQQQTVSTANTVQTVATTVHEQKHSKAENAVAKPATKPSANDAKAAAEKLAIVVQLLKADKAHTQKLRSIKEARTKALEDWKNEASTLKRRLLLLETSIEKEAHKLGALQEALSKREDKMKKRLQLKQRLQRTLKGAAGKVASGAKADPLGKEGGGQEANAVETRSKSATPSASAAANNNAQVRRKRRMAASEKPAGALKSKEPLAKVSKGVPQPPATAVKAAAKAVAKTATKQLVIPKSAITPGNSPSQKSAVAAAKPKGAKPQTTKKQSMQVLLMKKRLEEKERLLEQAKALQKERERLGTQLDIKKRQLSPKKTPPAPTSKGNVKQKHSLVAVTKSSANTARGVNQAMTKLNAPRAQSTPRKASQDPAVQVNAPDHRQPDRLSSDKAKTQADQGMGKSKQPADAKAPAANKEPTPAVTPTLTKGSRASRNSDDGDSASRRQTSTFQTPDEAVTDKARIAAQSIVDTSFSPDVLAPYLIEEDSGSAVTRLFAVPECLSKWKINMAELAYQSGAASQAEASNSRRLQGLDEYESPLRAFRSYRFSAFLRTQENVAIASSTFSHRVDPRRILCRYGLNGQCLDEKCRAQHLDDLAMKPNEIFLDLLSYCPSLLKKADGQPVKSTEPRSIHLQAAEAVVKGLCGPTSMTLDEKCILLVSHINSALVTKMPHTTHLHRMAPHFPHQTREEVEDDVEMEDDGQVDEWLGDQLTDIFASEPPGPRYFLAEGEGRLSELDRLQTQLDQNPDDVQVRIRLAKSYLLPCEDEWASMSRRLDLALNTLCLGIERDEKSEPLWCAYLPLLRHHHHGDLEDKEEEENIIGQVLQLLPFSKAVWREVMKWNWSYSKLDSLYQQLIYNLLYRYQANDENLAQPPEFKESQEYYSSWLLCSVVERCHLAQLTAGREQALSALASTLEELDAIKERQTGQRLDEGRSGDLTPLPVTQQDNCRLRLTHIHVVEFGGLPECFYDDSLSDLEHGLSASDQNIVLPFARVNRLNNDPDQLRDLIQDALLSCDDPNVPTARNIINNLPLYRALVELEASLRRWDAVSLVCERLIKMVQAESAAEVRHATDVWYVWIDAILGCGNPLRITQTFDRAVTVCPWSAKLAYTAAMYQLHCDNPDIEAALLYMETCLSTFCDLEGKNGLTARELHSGFKQLLKHDAPLIGGARKTIGDVDAESFQHEKGYLWLMYCLLTELSGGNSIDVYEAAAHNVANLEGRKAVWLHYLLHLRSTATPQDGAGAPESKAVRIELIQRRMKWIRNVTSVVRRCLQATPCKRSVDAHSFTDYSFHNEIADIYLSCFSERQKIVALSILADAMPTNVPLLLRAAGEHLKKGDTASVIATLWRVTSTSKSRAGCHDVRVWKIAIGAYLAERNFKKAIRLCQRSLTVMPYCYRLWRDVSALLALHGSKKDFEAAGVKCQKMLDQDIRAFVDDNS